MQFVLKTALLMLIIGTISSCSKLQFPWAYKIFVQQGNYLEEDMIEQLEVGMSPEQVRYIMGSPLITDTFHPDRWDYYFEYKRGDVVFKEYHVTMYFEQNKLASWEGDYQTRADKKEEETEEFEEAAARVEKAANKTREERGNNQATPEDGDEPAPATDNKE